MSSSTGSRVSAPPPRGALGRGLPARDGWLRAAATLCAPTPILRARRRGGPYPYTNSTVFAPPTYATQLFAGVLAPVALSNATVLAATLRQANAELHMASELPWCSNFAMYAMVAARLGMRKLAAELLVEPNATQASGGTSYYLVNGHCFNSFLPVYTPANGALLAAAAMLLGGGWDDDDGQPLPCAARWDMEGADRATMRPSPACAVCRRCARGRRGILAVVNATAATQRPHQSS